MKVFIHVMDLVGPQNACIGLGQQLVQMDHQVCFVLNEKYAEKFRRFSEKFTILPLKPAVNEQDNKSEQQKKDQIAMNTDSFVRLGLFDPLEPVDKIRQMMKSQLIQDLIANAECYEPQIKHYVQQERPDVFVVDAKLMSPCIMNFPNLPWVYLFCANPLGLFADLPLPPFSSGLPIDGPQEEWEKFRTVMHDEYFAKMQAAQKSLCLKFGYPPPKDQVFFPRSPYLNIYQFPAELDYDDTVQIPEHYVRVDGFVRDDPEPFEMPECLSQKMKPGDKLIFLSMGSMGSCNLVLMRKLVEILAKTPYFYIVSKGMLHEHYSLADNMWGDAYVAQTKIIPLVDLVIFHGGNNTLCETFYFGKPMIIMPLFYDQYNNAQRVQEKGFGRRLDAHRFTEPELLQSIDQVVNDQELRQKLAKISDRIRNSKSKELACKRIEQLVGK